jgi:hypothetical protein
MFAVGTGLASPPHWSTDSVDHGKSREAAELLGKHPALVDAVRNPAYERPRDGNERRNIGRQTGNHCGSEESASLDRSSIFEVVDEAHSRADMKEPGLDLSATEVRRGRSSKCADTRIAERPSGHCAREAEHGVNVTTDYDTPTRL